MERRNSYYTEINPHSKFVYCRDSGGSYTTYDILFDAYPEITKYKDRYAHKSLEEGIVYKVITEVPHGDQLCNIFVLENTVTGEIYLCANDDHSVVPVNVNSPLVTKKTEIRICKAIKEVTDLYPFMHLPYSIIIGRTLCITSTNSWGKNYYTYIPNVSKMSTKDITKRIKKFVEETL